jgi:hypothetical protein
LTSNAPNDQHWTFNMSLSPAALATARPNIVRRIARFIEALEQVPREPDPWECDHVQRALAAPDELDFPCGEQAMMWAEWRSERRSPEAMAKLQPVHKPATTTELRNQLDRIVRDRSRPVWWRQS